MCGVNRKISDIHSDSFSFGGCQQTKHPVERVARMVFLGFILQLWQLATASRSAEADESALLSYAVSHTPNSPTIAVVAGCIPEDPHYSMVCPIAKENFAAYVDYQNALKTRNEKLRSEEEAAEALSMETKKYAYKLFWFDAKPTGAEDRVAAWSKVPALQAALKDPDVHFAFWIDSDSLFMNFDERLEHLLPNGENHVSFSGGPFCFLNAGHMMFKNDAWTETFLKEVWETYPAPRPYEEQSAMVYVLWKHSSPEKARKCREKTVILPYSPLGCCNGTGILGAEMRAFNVMNENAGSFQPGHFLLHFPGKPEKKAQRMADYSKRVLKPSESISLLKTGKPRMTLQTGQEVFATRANKNGHEW